MPSIKSSSCNFQGDQSFSGCASQEGFGRLPAIEVGKSVFKTDDLVSLDDLKGVTGRPLIKNGLVWLDEVFLGKLSLLDGKPAAFFPIIDNARQ